MSTRTDGRGGTAAERGRARRARKAGFTLAEVLVVLAILMSLATIVTVNVLRHQREARRQAATIQLKQLQNAIVHYQTEQGRIPTMEQGLEALVAKPQVPPVPERYPADGYLGSRHLPRDPWLHDYVYIAPGREGTAFEIVCYGSDGQQGGDGDAKDISTFDL